MKKIILSAIIMLTAFISVDAQSFEWKKDGAVVPDGATLEYQIEMEEAVPGVLYRYAAVTGALEPDLALYNNTGAPLEVSVKMVSEDATGEGLQCCFGGQCLPFSSNTMTKTHKLSTEGGDMTNRLQLDYFSGMAPNPELAQKLADRTVTVTATAGGESQTITIKFVNALSNIHSVIGTEGVVDVYTPAGRCIKAGISSGRVAGLNSGLYIVRDRATKAARKVIVR